MPVDERNREQAFEAIRKIHGEDVIKMGTEFADIKRIPTGIFQLDAIIGGGFPLGRWVHPYGGYSSGKTLTMWHLIREAQKLGYSCAYYDIENQYDQHWAASIGVDTEKLIVINGSVIEEVGEILETLLGSVNIHVLDSIALGVSADELSAEIDEWRPGIAARAWGKVIRRANKSFDKQENMIVMINQTREIFGKTGGENPTGGKAVSFVSSLDLHFRKTSNWLYRDKNGNLTEEGKKTNSISGDTQPAGIEFQVRVPKSRVCDPLGVARIRLEFDSGGQFDNLWGYTRAAIFYNLVQRAGSWYTLPNGERVQGEAGLKAAIGADPEFIEKIKSITYG